MTGPATAPPSSIYSQSLHGQAHATDPNPSRVGLAGFCAFSRALSWLTTNLDAGRSCLGSNRVEAPALS